MSHEAPQFAYYVTTAPPDNYHPQNAGYNNRYPATIHAEPQAANVNPHLIQTMERRQWRDSIFNWGANIAPSCIFAVFCQCIILGQISQASGFAPFPLICCSYILIYIFFIILGAYFFGIQTLIWVAVALLIWAIRSRIRKNENIAGDVCEDGCVSFFCQSCAISQMARHLYQYREPCDEIVCSEDGRPSYLHEQRRVAPPPPLPPWQQHQQQLNQNAAATAMMAMQSPYSAQYVGGPPPQSTTAILVQPPQQPTIVKANWEQNIGGASAYAYSPPTQPQYNNNQPPIASAAPTIVPYPPQVQPQAQARSQYYEEEDAPPPQGKRG
jgi:Cys-rich protein (TIGR01571 family)